jgi:hypothetical protein
LANQARSWIEVAFGTAAAIAVFVTADQWDHPRVLATATGLMTVAGTLVGFLATALSILATVTDRQLIENMKKTGHFRVLLHDLFVTSGLFSASLLVLAGALMADGNYSLASFSIGCGMFAAGLVRLGRCGQRFYLTMLHL